MAEKKVQKQSNSRVYIYPFIIFGLVAALVFALKFAAQYVGAQTNPPQTQTDFFKGESEVRGWQLHHHESQWWAVLGGSFDLSQSHHKLNQDEAVLLTPEELAGAKEAFFFLATKATPEALDQLMSVMGSITLNKVYIASPYDSVVQQMRKKESRFYYAATPKELMKWRTWALVGLESLYRWDGDFILEDEQVRSSKLATEWARRRVPAFRPGRGGILTKTTFNKEL